MYLKYFQTFKYNLNFKKTHTIQYINNSVNKNIDEPFDSNIIKELYDMMTIYDKNTFDIYECMSFKDYENTFKSKDFYHFVIRNEDNMIVNYILIYKLGTGSFAVVWFAIEFKHFLRDINLKKITISYIKCFLIKMI